MGSPLADAALHYASASWPVFPITREKIPLVKDWANTATTDPEQIVAWWRQFPSANVATPAGRLIVIDVDGAIGRETRMRTEAEGLEWPITLSATTGRREGGTHFYYRAPEGVEIRNAVWKPGGRGIGPGVDVRGKGGLSVLPPSRHKSGTAYKWLVNVAPAPLPPWMRQRLLPPPARVITPPRISGDNSAYARAALDAEVEAVASAVEGTLNHTLNAAAYSLGRLVPTISEGTIREALLAAAVNAGHPERGARRTIESGLTAGMQRG